MYTRTRALRAGLAATVALAVLTGAAPAQASPWAVPSVVPPVTADAAPAEPAPAEPAPAEPATVDDALARGDLEAAQTLATEAREAEPSAATWQAEGEVLERSGKYARAARAYREAKTAAGDDAEAAAAAEEGLDRVHAASRGTVADEPASTHRKSLDRHWAPKSRAKSESTPPPPVTDVPPPERIVTKWYFWVTVGAIAASAAAVTAIAIRAARDDQPDALEALTPAPAPRGLGVLRF